MRFTFRPAVLVGVVAGYALGYYRPVFARASGSSSSGGGDAKKGMSCEEAIGQAEAAIAAAAILILVGESVLAGVCSGYARGVLTAACPSS